MLNVNKWRVYGSKTISEAIRNFSSTKTFQLRFCHDHFDIFFPTINHLFCHCFEIIIKRMSRHNWCKSKFFAGNIISILLFVVVWKIFKQQKCSIEWIVGFSLKVFIFNTLNLITEFISLFGWMIGWNCCCCCCFFSGCIFKKH